MGWNLTRVRLNRLSTGCLHGFTRLFNRVSAVFSTGFQQYFQQGFNRLFNRVSTVFSTGVQQVINRLPTWFQPSFQQGFNRLFNRVSTVFSTCYTQVFHQPVGVENVKKCLQIMCIYPELNRCCIQLLNHQVEHHVLNPG